MLSWRSGPWTFGDLIALLVLLAAFILGLMHALSATVAILVAALALARLT